MKEDNCQNCHATFYGRNNQIYCSLSCKITFNNQKAGEKRKSTKGGMEQLKANYSVLYNLHSLYNEQPIDKDILPLMGFRAEYFTGIRRQDKYNVYLLFDLGYILTSPSTIKIIKYAD